MDLENIGSALQTGFQDLQQRWTDWTANPANRAMLLQTGMNLMQPMAIGQSVMGHLGTSLGAGAEAKGRFEEQQRKDEQQNYERQQAESDRQFKRSDANRRYKLDERQVGISERNAASLEKYRQEGNRSLSSLFARDQDQLTTKLWQAATAEAKAANDAGFFVDGYVPKTPQDYLADPAWLAKTQQILGSLPGMPGSGSAGTVPPQAISPTVLGQTNTNTPQAQASAQPIPQPSAPQQKWTVGQTVTTSKGTFKLIQQNGQYTWQKI